MTDTELQEAMLQQFYDRRREGKLGFGLKGYGSWDIPAGVDQIDVLRVCRHLGDLGLIEWTGRSDEQGQLVMGLAQIAAPGVAMIEKRLLTPLESQKKLNISNSTGAQSAGKGNHLQQIVTHHVENLIRAIESAPVPDAEKKEARSNLAALLDTKAASALFGAGATALLRLLGQ